MTPDYQTDREIAALWAYEMRHRQAWCILDTETTGLGVDDEICQIAVIDPSGATLLNTLVKPIKSISAAASKIHGITDEMVQGAPAFDQVFLQLLRAIGDRDVCIYNSAFDLRLIRQSLKPYGIYISLQQAERVAVPRLPEPSIREVIPLWLNGASVYCAMRWFSQWCGEWSNYHGNYRWQRLPGGDHTALGDCMATLEIILRMADSRYPESLRQAIAEQTEPMPAPAEPVRLAEMPQIAAIQNDADSDEQYDDIPF